MEQHEIFLSYAHKNKDDVDELYDLLTFKYKLKIWKDTKSIRIGHDFREEIYHGIENAKLVLSCMSKDYIDSKTCIKELQLANKLDKKCLFILLENLPIDTIPAVSMLVIGEQRCQIFKNRVNNLQTKLWQGELFSKFISDIGLILGKDLKQYDNAAQFTIKRSKEKYHAFLSYNVEIQPTIQALRQHLEDNEFIIHYLSKENGADNWKYFMKIKDAIDSSAIFICCVTRNYLTNQSCLNEIDYAFDTKKPQMLLLFENLAETELSRLTKYQRKPVVPIKIFEDTDKGFLTGTGEHFGEVVSKLRVLVKENDEPENLQIVVDKMQILYDLFVTCDDEQIDHVANFLTKINPKRNLKIFHNAAKAEDQKKKPDYEAILQSETVLAIVSKNFEQSEKCVAELSYAHRNLKPTNILIQETVSLAEENEFTEVIKETDVDHVENDFSLLDKEGEDNPLAKKLVAELEKLRAPKIEEKVEVKPEEPKIEKEKTKESIKRGTSARIKSAKSVVEPVKIEIEHLSLHDAAEKGNIEELKYWVSVGKDLNERNSRGMTPIHLAAKEGHIDAVEYLIEQPSINKHEKDSDGRTALHLAASEGKQDVVQFLCKACNFDINEKDWRGLTPLHLAAQWGYSDTVSYLCDKGAKINEKSKDGWTPLYLASTNRRESIAKMLRQKGAR